MSLLVVEHEQARAAMRELDDLIAKLAHAIDVAEQLGQRARAARSDFERVRNEIVAASSIASQDNY